MNTNGCFLCYTEPEYITGPEQEMGFLVMDGLALLLNSNSQNASKYVELVWHDCRKNTSPLICSEYII